MGNPFGFIKAWSEKHSQTSHETQYITGTDLGGGKRGIDIYMGASSAPLVSATGTTDHFNGSLSTTAENIPSVAGNVITSILMRNTNATNVDLLLSLDGGVNFFSIPPQYEYEGSPKGSLTQVQVKANTTTCSYESIIDRLP